MKAWRATVAGLVAVTAVLTTEPTGAQPGGAPGLAGKVAYVDVQRVMARSAAGAAAREQLEREKATMQKEMEARAQEIQKLREEVEKKGSLMSAESRREKEESIERKRRDATRLADDFQRELSKKEQALVNRVLVEVVGVAERVGKERGFYLILERRNAGVIFAQPEADITDEIIRAYDAQNGKAKK